MSEGESQVASEGKGKPVAKRWAQTGKVFFDVNAHLEGEQMLDASVLAVDRDMTHGQTPRPVDRAHVKKLVDDFEQNPPGIMTLTVWHHSGLCD